MLKRPGNASETRRHHQHFALAPLNGELLKSGFVEVIYPNAPQVYARHEYQPNGGEENETLDVLIAI